MSDPLWQAMLERVPQGIGVLEEQSGQALWMNATLKTLLAEGAGSAQVLGWTPPEYLPGLSQEAWQSAWGSLLAGQAVSSEPQRLQFVHHATRQIAYWEWSVASLHEAGKPRYLMLMVQSVSETVLHERVLASAGRTAERARRRAEALGRLMQLVNVSRTTTELLRVITEQAAAFFDASHAAVWLLPPGEETLKIGYAIGLQAGDDETIPALARANTLADRALIQRQTLALSDLSHQPSLATPLLRTGAHPAALVSSPIWQDNRLHGVVEVYFTEPRHVPEDARSLLAAFADQTAIALHKADLYEQVGAQRRQLQSIFDNAPVCILYFDPSGNILSANTAAARQYGDSVEEMLGRSYRDYLADLPPGLFESACAGRPFHASHHVNHSPKLGEMVCDFSLLPVQDENRQVVGILLLSFEITELFRARQEADAARQEAETAFAQVIATQTQLVQMEKMRAIGELASGVAHDFNNALMAILGYAELAEESLNDPEELTSQLAIIRKAAEDAATTVQRLQRFARQNTVTRGEPTDINAVIQDVVKMTRPRWRDNAQKEGRIYHIETDLGDLPPIPAEPSGLREVLINMVYNALNAMPEGGNLVLATSMHGEEQVEIEIRDTGYGMTPEIAARIFDPFFTTRGVEGTGLGLAVSWTIIQRHRGTIEVDSAPGKGTRFYIRLPIRDGEVAPFMPSIPPVKLPPVSQAHILVVDDEPFVASVLTTILTRSGYRVTTAYAGQQALDLVKNGQEKFDLLLTDHGMPGMTGLQLIAELRQQPLTLPVLLLTGWGERLLETHVTEALPDAVLGKPINQTDLLDAVARVLQTKTTEKMV